MILGVDVSTSITGFAIVADDVLVYYDSVDLRKYKNIFQKTVAIKEKILDIFEMYQLDNEVPPWPKPMKQAQKSMLFMRRSTAYSWIYKTLRSKW